MIFCLLLNHIHLIIYILPFYLLFLLLIVLLLFLLLCRDVCLDGYFLLRKIGGLLLTVTFLGGFGLFDGRLVLFKNFFDFLVNFVLLLERFSCLEIDRFLIGFFSRIGGWGFAWEILQNLNLNSKIILSFWNEILKMFCLFFQFILEVGELLFFLICSYIKLYCKTEINLRLYQYLFYFNFSSIFSGLFLFDIF